MPIDSMQPPNEAHPTAKISIDGAPRLPSAINVLCAFYSSRSADLTSKGQLSYFLWAVFLLFTTAAYVFHYAYSQSNTSIFVTVYPFFLIGWLACIVYMNYRVKLSWVYLEQLEDATISLLFNGPDPEVSFRTGNQQFPLPLWATAHEVNIKKTGYLFEWLKPAVEVLLIAFFVLLLGVTWLKGLDFIINESHYTYGRQSALGYSVFIWTGIAALMVVHLILKRRVALARQTDVFCETRPRMVARFFGRPENGGE